MDVMGLYYVILWLCLLLFLTDGQEDSCISYFDISTSTIIRTQDSRDLGARYINETDARNKEECLQLCCDAHSCNVAVYEQKDEGGCYLFDCGSDNNFLCKFTSHDHYVSAVLKINRHKFDLKNWSKQEKHAQQLGKLKLTPSIRKPSLNSMSTSSSTTTAKQTTPITTTTTSTSTSSILPPHIENKCSQFQFKCQGSGDCIAVYNACDGIPQCADSSDEKPGLGCPIKTTHLPNPVPKTPPVSSPFSSPNDASYSRAGYDTLNREQAYRQQDHQPSRQQEIQPGSRLQQQQQSEPENLFSHRNGGLIQKENVRYPPLPHEAKTKSQFYLDQDSQYPQYPQYPGYPPARPEEGYITGRNGDMPLYTDSRPIYPVKPPPMYLGREDPYPVPPRPVGRENVPLYREGAPIYSETLGKDAVSYDKSHGDWLTYDKHYQWIHPEGNQQYPKNEPFPHQKHKQYYKQELQQQQEQQQQKGSKNTQANKQQDHVEITSKPPETKLSTATTTITTVKTTETSTKKPSAASVKTQDTGTNAVEDLVHTKKFRGAIAVVIAGFALTTGLLVLMICRLRAVRARSRRGGPSPYAHDADYLVNGMYL